MLTVFLRAKGYPTEVGLDLKTGQLTPRQPAPKQAAPMLAPTPGTNGHADDAPLTEGKD